MIKSQNYGELMAHKVKILRRDNPRDEQQLQ